VGGFTFLDSHTWMKVHNEGAIMVLHCEDMRVLNKLVRCG